VQIFIGGYNLGLVSPAVSRENRFLNFCFSPTPSTGFSRISRSSDCPVCLRSAFGCGWKHVGHARVRHEFVDERRCQIDRPKNCKADKAYFLYSKISPGWHSNALQIASKVDNRTALALLFFKMEMFAIVMPTFSASSVTLILRFANMTSMLMMIAILVSLHR